MNVTVCHCSLAGTSACRTCSNNPNAERPPTIRTYTVSATDKVLITGQMNELYTRKQTNADRIRNMSDAELAEWFIKIQDDVADYYDSGHAYAPELPTMASAWLDWLEQEAEE